MKSYRLSRRCLMLLLLGWMVSGPAQARSVMGAHVYLLRGIFNVSVGLDALADKLKQSGISATVYGHDEEGSVAAEALQQYQAGNVRPIILVGHSLGAGAAVRVAGQLRASGVPVALMVLLDPVSRAAVPSNVARTVNFYVSGGLGTTVEAEAGSGGSVANMDFRNAGMDHMSIQAADPIHRQIFAYIRAAAGGHEATRHAIHAGHSHHRPSGGHHQA
jgi:pimeloyl-ACP methyl ester carboxylesterase